MQKDIEDLKNSKVDSNVFNSEIDKLKKLMSQLANS